MRRRNSTFFLERVYWPLVSSASRSHHRRTGSLAGKTRNGRHHPEIRRLRDDRLPQIRGAQGERQTRMNKLIHRSSYPCRVQPVAGLAENPAPITPEKLKKSFFG